MAPVLPGLKELVLEACFSEEWVLTRNFLYDNLKEDTIEYQQLMNINARDNIFIECCEYGYKELLAVFLENDFPVDEFVLKCHVFPLRNCTLLHLAAKGGHVDLIKYLISCGANVNVRDGYGKSPLFYAAVSSFAKVVGLLIDHNADVSVQDESDRTVLHYVLSSHSANLDILTCLLQAGCDVNVKDEDNASPLCVCAEYANFHCVKLLLEFGANPNDFRTFWYIICGENIITVKGVIEILELMLMYGLNVNITDENNNTPLHIMAMSKRVKIIEWLLNHGADVNMKNNHGFTPTFYLFEGTSSEMLNMFFNKGADINSIDNNGNTLLHAAARVGILHALELLLDKGIDVNARNRVGYTPLAECAFIIDFGNEDSIRPIEKLHEIGKRYVYIIGTLINSGADANVTDKEKHTLIHWAAWYGRVDLLNFLIDYGLDVNAVDSSGYKAIDLARMTGHKDIEMSIFEYNCSKYSSCKHV